MCSRCAGALPYIIALDRDTKSVVISIRGTVTLADLATDMMAEPKAMDEWLPDSMAHVRSPAVPGLQRLVPSSLQRTLGLTTASVSAGLEEGFVTQTCAVQLSITRQAMEASFPCGECSS